MSGARCPNCGAQRSGRFCALCGQNDRDYRVSALAVFKSWALEAFDLEGRFMRTVRDLIAHPGQLTVAFSENRRASYVSPVRLYLVTSLVFFAVLGITSNGELQINSGNVTVPDTAVQTPPDSLERFRATLSEESRPTFDHLLAQNSWHAAILRTRAQDAGTEPVTRVGRYLNEQLVRVLDNPLQLRNAARDNLPFAAFLMLPLYALLLKLHYLGQHRFYAEHLVFGMHLHSFAFLLFPLAMLIPNELTLATDIATLALLSVFFWYYFRALRVYYDESRARTAVKFVSLAVSYVIGVTPVLALVLVVTFTMI